MNSPAATQRSETDPADQHSSSAIYLLRTTQQHHVHLSSLADHKASMLMGASFVVVTIVVGQLQNRGFNLPLLTLGLFALLSAVFAILAVLPRTGRKSGYGGNNMLFFGAFVDLSQEEYIDKMDALLRTDENVYRMMLRDIYQMGKLLHETKFKYLTYGYRTFLAGLIATFVVALASYTAR